MNFRLKVLKSVLVGVIVTAGMFALLFAGYTSVENTATAKAYAKAEVVRVAVADRDARIVAHIVKSNPTAAIKDFGGDFPSYLYEQAERRGIDFRLAMALIDKESQWNPSAVGRSGEVGLMQMLPSTALLVAKRLEDTSFRSPRGKDLGSLADARVAVSYGLEYLYWQVKEFGGVGPVSLRAYNRNPDKAREHRPLDTYAEDVAKRFVVLAHRLPR
jgi:soluble lytic murein transglycosylase-like protein